MYTIDQEYHDELTELKTRYNNLHINTCISSEFPVPDRIGLLFIDGDNRYDGVKADFERFFPSVMPGGTVIFHDASPIQIFDTIHPGVIQFVSEVAKPDPFREMRMVDQSAILVKR